MNIEHFDCLSWFSRRRESHEQDGERLSFATTLRIQKASGDPAMAIGPIRDIDGLVPVSNRQNAILPGKWRKRLCAFADTRAEKPARKLKSAANTEPLDQLL